MYLYFDCFAGFDVFMALGAVLDITKDSKEYQAICDKLFPGTVLHKEEVTRSSMEACKVSFTAIYDKKMKLCELLEYIDSSTLDTDVKTGLSSFAKIIAGARSLTPENSVFDMQSFVPVLCASACIFHTIKKDKIKNVWISKPLCSNSFTLTENGFESVTKPETHYIAKKYKIDFSPSECDFELFTEDGAALLACLEAKNTDYSFGNIVKIGYGAGEKDTESIINILRAVVGNDDETDTLCFESSFEAEMTLTVASDIYCEKDTSI